MLSQPTPSLRPSNRATRRLLGIVCALSLTACTTVPLPQWPSTPVQDRGGATTQPIGPTGERTGSAASTQPVSQQQVHAMPYSQAVAAHFPAPAVSYTTPGLSSGEGNYTNNQTLTNFLRQLPQETGRGIRTAILEAGFSQQGQPIHAVLTGQLSDLSPAAIDSQQRPTVMIVAGQQGNAPASTEAALALLQTLNHNEQLQAALGKMQILLVPRANPDGFSQGQAHTANGVDLRHDHLQLSTPEARALSQLITRYQPAVVLELGEYPALSPSALQLPAVTLHDVGAQYGITHNAHEFIVKAEREWFYQPLAQRVSQAGLSIDWLSHPAAPTAAEPAPSLAMDTLAPTTLANVATLKNAIGLVIHSRGSDLGPTHLQRRIHSHMQAMLAVLDSTSTRVKDIAKVQNFVARDTASQACEGQFTLSAQARTAQRKMSFIDLDTAQVIDRTVAWQSSLDQRQQQHSNRPCGYWLSPDAQDTAALLDLLGVRVQRIAELSPLAAESFFTNDGDRLIQTQRALLEATPGSYYVSLSQPLAHLATAVLEPATSFSSYSQGGLSQLSDVARVINPPSLVFAED